MGKRILRFLQYFIFLGGGIFLVWWQLKSMTPAEKAEFNFSLTHANFKLLIPVALMSLLSHISRSMRWKLLMEPLGYQPSLINAFGVTMVGYLANSAIPRLGEILKCTLLGRYEKLKVDKLVGTIIVERSFDVICYVFLVFITVLLQFDKVDTYIKEHIHLPSNTMAVPFWVKPLVFLLVIFLLMILVRILFRRLNHFPVVHKINGFFSGVKSGFTSILQLKKKKQFMAHTLFIWAMYLGQIYIGFKSMDGTHQLGIQAAMSVLTLASLSIIITPGGIGSFPIFVMETLTLYHIHEPLGKAFGWLMWGVSTGFIIFFGVICLLILPYINHKKYESNTVHPS